MSINIFKIGSFSPDQELSLELSESRYTKSTNISIELYVFARSRSMLSACLENLTTYVVLIYTNN